MMAPTPRSTGEPGGAGSSVASGDDAVLIDFLRRVPRKPDMVTLREAQKALSSDGIGLFRALSKARYQRVTMGPEKTFHEFTTRELETYKAAFAIVEKHGGYLEPDA